jgi:SOS-response transcriptional repressor LexA|tara:strand:+ start:2937 stop:3254 length:318 start_codon:yes stop_codon:yes gene_type:complete
MKLSNGINGNGNGHNIFLSSIKLNVLIFIRNFIQENDYSPTYLEIGKQFKFSRARAGAIISELYKLGLISKIKQSTRNIEINKNQLEKISRLKVNKTYSTMSNQS